VTTPPTPAAPETPSASEPSTELSEKDRAWALDYLAWLLTGGSSAAPIDGASEPLAVPVRKLESREDLHLSGSRAGSGVSAGEKEGLPWPVSPADAPPRCANCGTAIDAICAKIFTLCDACFERRAAVRASEPPSYPFDGTPGTCEWCGATNLADSDWSHGPFGCGQKTGGASEPAGDATKPLGDCPFCGGFGFVETANQVGFYEKPETCMCGDGTLLGAFTALRAENARMRETLDRLHATIAALTSTPGPER
jgi:hypothetical protein